MNTLIHADIFFFITSIFIVFITIGFVVALAYIIPILKNIRYISMLVRKEGDKLAQDIEGLRSTIKEEGSKITQDIEEMRGSVKEKSIKVRSILDYFLTYFSQKKKIVRKKKINNNSL